MIRVIIERHIREGCYQDYLELIRKARKQANRVEGFIAGELLQEKENPNHAVIISSWENFESWKTWLESKERLSVLDEMRPLLEGDEEITVLESSQAMF
ncbi:antibiotic biosynthesis monooxygenase [Aliikangiella sp. G2MR2-5]|uniref:antibiotic biosynthesis monooxygenase family protein n=1 Tax=Aliikangiella sp. G2MR2-5 TaxID=2788943 RepID=UPI0018AAB9D8|nr:antibiotic biosynthesis monooxygenase family protein [Aliikangiella sp. G2MR2-5]